MFLRASFTVLVLLAFPLAALAGGAPVALRVPAKQVCGDEQIRVGVRYTGVVYDRLPYNSNPRWYRVRIFDPHGRRVFERQGIAGPSWRNWTYAPSRRGVYRTRYGTAVFAGTFITRVGAC
jgi:hypothetical protein